MFLNRTDAGRKLSYALEKFRDAKDACVLSIVRGGVEVGYEIAKELHIPMDVLIVRKIGEPQNPEYAIGALSEGGSVMIDNAIIKSYHIPWSYIDRMIPQEKENIVRMQNLYRQGDEPLPIERKKVIIVDDGLATGYTMKVAVDDVKKSHASQIIIAIPVAPADILREMRKKVDEVVCLLTPDVFLAVGNHYIDFSQVYDEKVITLLRKLKENSF